MLFFFTSSTYLRLFFIVLYPFLGKIDLISEIIDLNNDSLCVILSFFLKILNNSPFLMIFLHLYLSYLQLTLIHALINLQHLVSSKNIYKKNLKNVLLYSSQKNFFIVVKKLV